MFKDCFSLDNLSEFIIHIYNEFEDMTGHSASSLATINAAITGELDFVDAKAVEAVKAFLREYLTTNGVAADELEGDDGLVEWINTVDTLYIQAFGLGSLMICPYDKAEEYITGVLQSRAEAIIDEQDRDSALKYLSPGCLLNAAEDAARAVLGSTDHCCNNKFVLFG